MEVSIIQEEPQPVFGRTHLTVNLTFENAVPSRGDLATKLAQMQNVEPDRISIRAIEGRFGGATATADVYVYEDAERLAAIELEHVVERTKKSMPEPEAPAEEAAEEAPAEEAEAAPAEEAPAAEESAEEPAAEEATAEAAAEEPAEAPAEEAEEAPAADEESEAEPAAEEDADDEKKSE